jgi:hypothetical protein
MQYVTQRFENTRVGLSQKDTYSRQMSAQGYHIVSEQLEAGHRKGGEQCCLFAACVPCVFLAGRTSGFVVVTYGREVFSCPKCGVEVLAGTQCSNCLRIISGKAAHANALNAEAKKSINKVERLLADGIAGDYRFNWVSLVKPYPFVAPHLDPEPALKSVPLVVRAAWEIPYLERVFPWVLKRRLAWEEIVQFEARSRSEVVEQHGRAVEDWKRSKESLDQEQLAEAAERRRLYECKDQAALFEYWARVLEHPIYGVQTGPVRSMAFLQTPGKLILSYVLPPIAELPKIEEVRYSQRENAVTEVTFSAERLIKLYRDLIIQIALVVIYRLFQSDTANALNSVAFKATGREISPCVIAVQSEKLSFMEMNFSLLDAAACFERLGGRISEEPIAPIAE